MTRRPELIFILCTGLIACQTPKAAKKVEPLKITYVKPKPPPEPTKGGAFPLPAPPMTPSEDAAMKTLGLPDGGVCLTIEKAKKVGDLRTYAQDTHADALFNFQVGQTSNQIVANQIDFADKQLKAAAERENSWWNKHKAEVMFVGGLIIGSALTTGIVYGVNQASQ